MSTLPDEPRLLAAAATLAGQLGLGALQPRVIGRFSNLVLDLAPTPWVLRVATGTAALRPDESWSRRELQLGQALAAAHAPAAPPAPVGLAGPHRLAGLRATLWRRVTVLPEPPCPLRAGAALARCHRALREAAPATLPTAPAWGALDETGRLLHAPAVRAAAHPADLALVEAQHQRSAERLRAWGVPLQWLHGDAHINNVVDTPGGPCWLDWEDALRAPLEWDLAGLVAAARVLGSHAAWSEAALQGWTRHAGPPDDALLAECVRARTLFVVAWTWQLGPDDPARQPRLRQRLDWLRQQR